MGKILVMTTDGLVDTNTEINGTTKDFIRLAGLIESLSEVNIAFENVSHSNFATALSRTLADSAKDNNTFNGKTLKHASKGKKDNEPITVIGYMDGDDFYIIGVGKHVSSSTYKLCYLWQPESKDLKENSIYDLNIKDKKLS